MLTDLIRPALESLVLSRLCLAEWDCTFSSITAGVQRNSDFFREAISVGLVPVSFQGLFISKKGGVGVRAWSKCGLLSSLAMGPKMVNIVISIKYRLEQ